MRVLVVTNMYPTAEMPSAGIFVSREVEAVRRLGASGLDLELAHIDTVGARRRYLSGPARVAAAIARFRPDLVHVHYGLSQALAVSWRGSRVVTFHGSDLTVPWQRLVSRRLVTLEGTLPIVVSPHLLSELPEHARGRARVIGCGVDTSQFKPGDRHAARHRMGLKVSDGELVIGFPSSPARPGKDHPLFEAVLRALAEGGLKVQALPIDGLAPDEVPHALRSLDVLLMTSRHEGSPVVTREAMCCGVRVVSVDVGDVAEQVAGFDGCAVVESRSPVVLADAVREVLAQAAPDVSMAAQRFGIERQASDVLAAYRDALGGRS